MSQAWVKRTLGSQQRSPLARRIINYQRSFDPPMTDTAFASLISVAKQTLSAWMYSKSEPQGKNVHKLASILNCSVAELERDIELSRNWVPPFAWDEFVANIDHVSQKEHWPDREPIMRQLVLIREMAWNDGENNSPWLLVARDVLAQPLPSHDKALRLAHIVRAARDPNMMKPL